MPPLTTPRTIKRLTHLDGVRGIACLIVLFCHFPRLRYVPIQYFLYHHADTFTRHYLAHTPFSLLRDGTYMVKLFFMLSGFVIGLMALGANRAEAIAYPTKRYIRLMFPAFFSLLLAQATYAYDLNWFAALKGSLSFDEKFSHPFWFANPTLWTIAMELWGSMAIFIILPFLSQLTLRIRWGIMFIIMLILLSFHLGHFWPFFVGALMADAYREGFKLKYSHWIFLSAILIAGLHIPSSLLELITTAMVVAGVAWSPGVAHFFNYKICQFFGKHSFSIYLIHCPLIPLFDRLIPDSLWLIEFPFIVLLAMLSTRLIDAPCIRLSNKVSNFLVSSPLLRQLSTEQKT